jgi:hypothetical protein
MNSDLQHEPPPLPPPVPPRAPTSGQHAAEGSFPSVALALFGGFVGCVAGAAYSVFAVYAAALAARDIAEPGAAAFVALGVYGLAVVLFFAIAGAAAFGFRSFTSQLSALPLVAIVIVRAWIQRAPTTAAAGEQFVAISWDTTLVAALVWAIAGGVLAWRLCRTTSLTQSQEGNLSL